MSRVLVTGGTGRIGSAVVRRLLGDPDFEIRVSDPRPAPDWMREAASIHTGDLRDLDEARRAVHGCSHVIHLAASGRLPFALIEVSNATVRAAVDERVERFTYVSSSTVFERAEQFPTTEEHLRDCPPPRSAHGRAALAGELGCRAAHDEHGLPFTICRPFLTHVDDIADGIVVATASPAGENEDFNIAAAEEVTVAEGDVQRCWPSVEKAARLLGWRARIGAREGIARLSAE